MSPSNSGTATDLTDASPYEAGTAVNITAAANQGYRFVNWTAPAGIFGNSNAAVTTFTMPAQNVTATANFVAVYSLAMAVSPVDSGTATDLSNVSPYEAGTVVNIRAIPATGYRFTNWTAPAGIFGNVTAAATDFTIPAQNVTVTASFQKLPTVTTETVTNITSYSAIVNMSYTVGSFASVEVRFVCKRAADQASFYTTWVSVAGDGTHTEKLTGLASKTNYEYKAQLRYDGTVIEGATRPFTTASGASPSFCFIATAAYGTPSAQQIDALREFRDVVLLKSAAGSQFVALYYQLSPPVADFIARSDLSRTLVRKLLVDPIVWAVEAAGEIWRD
ncbi:MAG TPA: CFI-box-CTERM domain-containing protein [Dehalococcoidia bacterium]|nr:CFI-box-CTERM domain-containing protein [Dehalococcoidia bacterium]